MVLDQGYTVVVVILFICILGGFMLNVGLHCHAIVLHFLSILTLSSWIEFALSIFIMFKDHVPYLIKPNGNLDITDIEKAKLFGEHKAKIFSPHDYINHTPEHIKVI